MQFTPFSESRRFMTDQYEIYEKKADKERSEKLYLCIRRAFDSEEIAVLGKALANEVYLDGTQIFNNPHDIFADLADSDVMSTPIRIRKEIYGGIHKKAGEAKRLSRLGAIFANGDYSHTMPDWEKLLKVGFCGIAREAEKKLALPGLTEEQKAFYKAVKITYDATSRYALRHAELAEKVGTENSLFAAKNLYAIAKRPPKTLAEAMQLFFIYYFVQHKVEGAALRSLGEIDTYLLPFYLSDLARGVEKSELCELIRYFLFKWSTMKQEANIPFDFAAVPNELSYVILEEYIALDVLDPKLHVKVNKNTPRDFKRLALRSIRDGKNSFVFINDEVVQKSLMGIGISKEDSKSYSLIGCYEPAAVGRELPCTVNGKVLLPYAITFALDDIKNGVTPAPDNFEKFSDAVLSHVQNMIDISVEEINTIEKKYPRFMCIPSLSGTFTDAMEKGMDVYAGGAKYNNSSICAFGLATFVDGMLAVKRAVYDDKIISIDRLISVLDANWEGEEPLRRRIMKFEEKYGRGNAVADDYTKETVNFLSDKINGRPNGRGGVYRFGLFSINWIFDMSKNLCATPDGRYKGEVTSKNLSPALGMDINGVTGILHTVLAQDHTKVPNGAVIDIALHPTAVSGEEGLTVMAGLLDTYIAGGGFAIQFNVIGRETLILAQENPEKYKNLQVRLCGWNVYFCDLEREVQDNLIKSMSEA